MMLGSLAKAPGAVDGLLATNQFPESSTGVVLPTPWQTGGNLWYTATMADALSNGQGYAIDI